MTVTCPYCKRKFHKGKTSEFGRLSKHIWKEHTEAHRRRIKKGQRTSRSQLIDEMEYTDDMIVQALQDAGINISPVRQPYPLTQQQYAPIPGQYQQTEHENIVGAILTAFKVGMAIRSGVKTVQKVRSKYVKKRPTGKGTKYKGGRGKKVKPR